MSRQSNQSPDLSSPLIEQQAIDFEERTLYAPDAERAFLACIMRNNDLINDAQQLVPAHHLFVQDHAYIYRVMLYMYDQVVKHGWPLSFTPVAMGQMARRLGQEYEERFYQRTNGLEKIQTLASIATHIDLNNWEQFIHEVNDRAARVQMYRQFRLNQLQLLDVANNPSTESIALDAQAKILEPVYHIADSEHRITHLAEQEPIMLAKAYLNASNPDLKLFNTPCMSFPRLMAILGGGFVRRGLTMLFARPKVGKTTILVHFLLDCARRGWPALLIDNEMGREKMYSRQLSACSGWLEQDIIAGKMYGEARENELLPTNIIDEEINRALAELRDLPVYYVNAAGRPTSFITSMMRQFRDTYVGKEVFEFNGEKYTFSYPSLTVYDWFRLNIDDAGVRNAQEYQQIGYQFEQLRAAAADLDLAVVAGAQQNRTGATLTAKDWANKADLAAGASDRFAMRCDCKLDIRHLDPEEQKYVLKAYGMRKGTEDSNEMRTQIYFNQLMYVNDNRAGGNCPEGLPIFHDFGRFRYEEMNDAAMERLEKLPPLFDEEKKKHPNRMREFVMKMNEYMSLPEKKRHAQLPTEDEVAAPPTDGVSA